MQQREQLRVMREILQSFQYETPKQPTTTDNSKSSTKISTGNGQNKMNGNVDTFQNSEVTKSNTNNLDVFEVEAPTPSGYDKAEEDLEKYEDNFEYSDDKESQNTEEIANASGNENVSKREPSPLRSLTTFIELKSTHNCEDYVSGDEKTELSDDEERANTEKAYIEYECHAANDGDVSEQEDEPVITGFVRCAGT